MVNKFLRTLHYGLLPGQCLLCDLPSHQSLDICHPCFRSLPWLLSQCANCAIPLPEAQAGQLCAQCLRKPPPFKQIVSPWLYDFPIDTLINRFKHHKHYAAGHVLAAMLSEHLCQLYNHQALPDMIMPTPLHWFRQFRRGFNQSYRLAHALSRTLKIPLSQQLRRHRHTPHQQGLTAKQRRKNLRGAFTVKGDISGKTIALVDDVVTTTATITEISHTLLDAGAEAIEIWCLARTPAQR